MNLGDLERRGAVTAAACAVASHATALAGGYVWLDHAHLEEGLALAPPGQWLSLFTQGFAGTGYYRPLTALSFSLDAVLSGEPAFYHAVTLGWHAAASALVVRAARTLGASARAALLAGVFFAVHPATSLVASAIAFRSEAMMTVALLALVIAHTSRRPLLAGAALLAGALVKETAWVLGPLFVLALGRGETRTGATDAGAPGRAALFAAEGTAFGVASLLHGVYAPHFRAGYGGLPLADGIGSRLGALAKSALIVLAPFDGRICDAFPITPLASAWAVAGAASLAFIAWLALDRGVAARLLVLSILPLLQVVPVMRWWSPHYAYLPLAFVAMLLAELVLTRTRWMQLVPVPLAACAVLSLQQGFRYRADAALWAPEVVLDPACREGHFFLGEAARQERAWEVAARHYEVAARPIPGILSYADEVAALQNLGAMRAEQERWPEARAAWTEARERVVDPPRRRRLVHNLAIVALRSSDPAEAVRLLEPEARAPEPLPESLFLLARALHELGREREAGALLGLLGAQGGR